MRPRGLLAACVPLALVGLPTVSACSTTANVSDVYTALDGDGARRRSTFFTDTQEIHCIAEMGVGRADVTVEGYIHQIRGYDFEKGDFEVTDRFIGFADIRPELRKDQKEPTKIDLSLGRIDADGKASDKAPFLAGSYICEIFLDGKMAKSANFNIDFPDCPSAFIIPAGPCFGFFEKNRECRKYGLRSQDDLNCKCSVTKGWECDPG